MRTYYTLKYTKKLYTYCQLIELSLDRANEADYQLVLQRYFSNKSVTDPKRVCQSLDEQCVTYGGVVERLPLLFSRNIIGLSRADKEKLKQLLEKLKQFLSLSKDFSQEDKMSLRLGFSDISMRLYKKIPRKIADKIPMVEHYNHNFCLDAVPFTELIGDWPER